MCVYVFVYPGAAHTAVCASLALDILHQSARDVLGPLEMPRRPHEMVHQVCGAYP